MGVARVPGGIGLVVEGPADPLVAWERYAVPAAWPTWAPQLGRVDADGPRIAPGVRGRVWPTGLGRLPLAGLPFEVTAVDEASRTWAWRVRLGPAPLRVPLAHGVEPGPGGGTRTWLRLPAALLPAYAPVALLALRRLVA